jgi:hypothetical protein
MIIGNLEITIKINEFTEAKTVENDWQQFDVDCNGRILTVIVKPKVGKKLTVDCTNYPQWVTAMSKDKPRSVYAGKLGHHTENGFVLERPNIQVFEFNKPRAEATVTASPAELFAFATG